MTSFSIFHALFWKSYIFTDVRPYTGLLSKFLIFSVLFFFSTIILAGTFFSILSLSCLYLTEFRSAASFLTCLQWPGNTRQVSHRGAGILPLRPPCSLLASSSAGYPRMEPKGLETGNRSLSH